MDRPEACPQKNNELTPEEALEKAGVSFIRLTHGRANTLELCCGIGSEYGASHCKNLLLTNRAGNSFWLLLMDAEKPYRTSDVSKKLGVSRLSFASPEQLKAVLGLEPGSVSVMGMVNECAMEAYRDGRLRLAIDADILKRERLCVHPNTDTATLVVSVSELIRFLGSLGIASTPVEI